MRSYTKLSISIVSLIAVFLTGCGKKESVAENPDEPKKNYKEMLERAKEKKDERDAMNRLQQGVQDFQMRFGRLPTNLLEVATFDIISNIPNAPEGYIFSYDPRLGNVSLRATPQDSRAEGEE